MTPCGHSCFEVAPQPNGRAANKVGKSVRCAQNWGVTRTPDIEHNGAFTLPVHTGRDSVEPILPSYGLRAAMEVQGST